MLKGTLAILGLTLSLSANAVLIDNGTFTTDTASGLDWIDLSETTGFSYSSISFQFGEAGQFSGWRFATTADLEFFFRNAGGAGTYTGGVGANNSAASTLVSLWGNTEPVHEYTAGGDFMYNAPYTNGRHYYGRIVDYYPDSGVDYIRLQNYHWDDNRSSSTMGFALVRASEVPAPAAGYLFVSALAGFLSINRRKQ